VCVAKERAHLQDTNDGQAQPNLVSSELKHDNHGRVSGELNPVD